MFCLPKNILCYNVQKTLTTFYLKLDHTLISKALQNTKNHRETLQKLEK